MIISSHIKEIMKAITLVILFFLFTIILPYSVLLISCAVLEAFLGISCTSLARALIAPIMSIAAAHIFFRVLDTWRKNRLREESKRQAEQILEQLRCDFLEDSSEEHW